MKNKGKSDQGSYANLYKQKLVDSNQNKTSILMEKEKKGINFDDLNDWMEIKFQKNDDSNFQQEYQNNNIESKQDLNIYGLLPQSNSNINMNSNYAPNKTNAENKFLGVENKEDFNSNPNRNSIYQNNININNAYNKNYIADLNQNLVYDANSNNIHNPLVNHIPEYSNTNFNLNHVENNTPDINYSPNLINNSNPNYFNINKEANNNINNIYNNRINENKFDERLKQISDLNNMNKDNQLPQNKVNMNLRSDAPINNFQNNYNNNVSNNNQMNLKYSAVKETEKYSKFDINNNNYNNNDRKNSKEDHFPNYPIRENDEFSINTSNFTNRWDLGNYGDKMDMSNLQNNNLAFKNNNLMINYTKDNAEDLNLANNTVENHQVFTNNKGNEAHFSSSIKNQMASLTNKINNIPSNRNIINQVANAIHPIIENESLDDELTNNKLEDDLRNQYLKSNNNFNNQDNNMNDLNQLNNNQQANINYKEFYNKEKLSIENVNKNSNGDLILKKNLLPDNLIKQKALNVINPSVNQNNMNNKKHRPKNNLDNENSEDDSDNESSGFKNEIGNDLNITQNQLNDLKKEIYEINKQNKKQITEADIKNKISSNKIKTLKNLNENNQNITANANNTNFTEKTKITNLSTAKGDLNNNNNANSNNLNQKIKRKPSPYLRNKEPINAEKASASNMLRQSKSNDAKNFLINNNNDLSAKPISIQTFQQNTNIMHIDPMVNPIPQMIYNMNTFNNNYANGYGNINLAYNPMLPAHGMNMPYNSLLPQMNYMNNLNIPNPIYGGFPAQNQAVIGNYNSNIQNLNSNPNNNITNDTTSIQDSYMLKNPKSDNASGYKPYTIKDYKEKINDVKKLEKLPRSLGANIGTKEWEEKAEKNKKAKDYAKNISTRAANKKLYNPILAETSKDESFSNINYKNQTSKNTKNTSNYQNIEKKKDDEQIKIKSATEERKPVQVKDFYSNLKGIIEGDDEDSFEDFENKLERELDNPKNRNSIKKMNTKVKNKTDADSLDDLEVNSEDEDPIRTKKIQSGKSHIHNLINLKKTSSDKNTNEIRNVNENAVITVDIRNKDVNQEKDRPKSTSKLENINRNNNKLKSKIIKGKEAFLSINAKNNKNSHTSSYNNNYNDNNNNNNKIYTTLGTDRDIVNRLKPLNTSRINSSLNTTRVSRPVSSKNINKNPAKNINLVNANLNQNLNNNNHIVRKSDKENIDDLLQKHDLYYEKAKKIKNFMSKL